jgi:hypothetical protein
MVVTRAPKRPGRVISNLLVKHARRSDLAKLLPSYPRAGDPRLRPRPGPRPQLRSSGPASLGGPSMRRPPSSPGKVKKGDRAAPRTNERTGLAQWTGFSGAEPKQEASLSQWLR